MSHRIAAHDVRKRQRMRRWFDAFRLDRGERVEVIENPGELRGEALDVLGGKVDAREAGYVEDFLGGQRHGISVKGGGRREKGEAGCKVPGCSWTWGAKAKDQEFRLVRFPCSMRRERSRLRAAEFQNAVRGFVRIQRMGERRGSGCVGPDERGAVAGGDARAWRFGSGPAGAYGTG